MFLSTRTGLPQTRGRRLAYALCLLQVSWGYSCATTKPARKAAREPELSSRDDERSSVDLPPSKKAMPRLKLGVAAAGFNKAHVAATDLPKSAAAPTPPPGAAAAVPVPVLVPIAAPVATAPGTGHSCRELVKHFAPIYQELFTQLPAGSYAKSGSTIEQLAFADPAQCDDAEQRKVLTAAAIDAVNSHSGRIGVILPLTGPYAKQATYVVNGLRAAFAEGGLAFDKMVVLKDSGSAPNGTVSHLAELIFKDKVSMVIGGFERDAAVALVQWADRLLLPVLIMNRERELTGPSKYAFMVHPDEDRLATTMAEASRDRSYKRIAILRPDSGRADKVSAYFKAAFVARGGQITAELTYTSNNFESMQSTAKTLLHTDMHGREKEFKEAYKQAQDDATAEGIAFNPRMVVLKPIIDSDAVFIPDDFRSVRYFAKIFKFNQVEKLPLIGNYEWRSPALIEPYDDFLTGSIFGDFIGNYTKLPAAVTAAPLGNSPFFVEPQMVQVVDFQSIGYRVGRIAKAAIAQTVPNRRQLQRVLLQLNGEQTGLPVAAPIFDKERHCFWPTYVFSVMPHELRLEHIQSTSNTAPAPQPAAPPPNTVLTQKPAERVCTPTSGRSCLSAKDKTEPQTPR